MIRTLAAHIGEYRRSSIATPIFMILEVIAETVIPLLMASIINDGIEAGDMHHIYVVGGLMVVTALFGLCAGLLGGYFGAKAATGFAKNLREALFEKIQTFSFTNLDKFSTPSLVTRVTTDVTNIQNAYQQLLRSCTRAPASLICAMGAAFLVSPRVASIYLVAVVILGVLLFLIARHANRYFEQVFPKYDDMNESVQENVSSIRVVKAYVREDYETDRFHKASGNIYRLFVKAEKNLSYNNPLMSLTVDTCILLVSWVGANLIVAESLSTGALASLLAYCMNILMSLNMLSMVFVTLSMSIASMRRVAEVLNEESSMTNPENPVMEIPDGSIEFRHVTFRYHETSEKPVLSDINLKIRSGETIGIIGGTGSAKTTLVSLISRLYDVSDGAVMVGGKDVRDYDMDALRDNVSVVLQKNELFSGTVLENLRWGDPNATLEDCRRACRQACADEFIEKMPEGYNTRIEQGGNNVSGGQKQRLCIARALLKKPKILILDDSTSAVDTATDAKIRKAFAEEIPNTTKIIIAQRISSVENADRVIVMENGQVSGFDTPENLLLTNDIYREVYESQIKGSGDFDEIGGDN